MKKLQKIFSAYLGGYLSLWFVLGALILPTVMIDPAENILWGSAPSWGYYKHPPLVAWLLHLGMLLTGSPTFSVFFLSALSIGVCFIYIYKLSREFLSIEASVLAVVATSLIYYYGFASIEFNQDVIMLPLWAMLSYYAYKAFLKPSILSGTLVGCLAGLNWLAKYEAGVILVCLLMYFFLNNRFHNRKILGSLLVAMGAMFIIVLPHIIWVFNHQLLPLKYMFNSGNEGIHGFWSKRLIAVWDYITVQGSAILLTLLVAYFTGKRAPNKKAKDPFYRHFLFWVGVGPALVVLLIALVMGVQIKGYWAFPFFSYTASALIYYSRKIYCERRVVVAVCLCVFCNVAMCATLLCYVYFYKTTSFMGGLRFPAKSEASYVDKIWKKYEPGKRLRYIAGDRYNTSYVGTYSNFSPLALIDFSWVDSPWVSPGEFSKYGGVVIMSSCSSKLPETIRKITDVQVLHFCKKFKSTFSSSPRYIQRQFFLVPPMGA